MKAFLVGLLLGLPGAVAVSAAVPCEGSSCVATRTMADPPGPPVAIGGADGGTS